MELITNILSFILHFYISRAIPSLPLPSHNHRINPGTALLCLGSFEGPLGARSCGVGRMPWWIAWTGWTLWIR